ncbi:PAS domain-containing protein [Clostridia bacterium]|nr:PAS domain-containing protein [Clostridia bacterium]
MSITKELSDKIAILEATIEKQSEELEILETAFDLAEIGFTISNADGIVIKINPAQIRITGHSPEMTLGRSMDVIETENNNQSATMQVVRTKEAVTIEQVLPSGKSYLVYGKPYFNNKGHLKYVFCNLVDTTELNYTLQELDASKTSNRHLEKTVEDLRRQLDMQNKIVYCSTKMQKLIDLCDKIAPFNSTVFISGESGSGKELIADYIVENSTRANKPFIKINCGAIPENLLELELFGYDAGAFTSAPSKGKKGILELADGGTILLDEMEEFPLRLQPKILRVLLQGEFYHVGGTEAISTNVRIIAASNRDLEEMIEKGTFRKDLYYRLSVIHLAVPSLKERPEDIPLLIRHFLRKSNEKYELDKDLTLGAMDYLETLSHEGNIRDLQNTIERIVLLSQNRILGIKDVMSTQDQDYTADETDETSLTKMGTGSSLKSLVAAYEKELLHHYWMKYKSASKIAELLDSNQPTISRKLHQYDIL